MSKKQQPFLPMFVGDFMAATAEWEGEEQALYGLLLMHQWALGHLPVEIPKLARLVRFDQHNFERWWPVVSSKFELEQVDGFGLRLVNPRLEQHRAKSIALSEKNSVAGKLGAEVKKRKQSERHPKGSANANGSGSERFKSASAPIVKQSIPSHPIPSDPSQRVLPPSSLEPSVRALTPSADPERASEIPEGRNGERGFSGDPTTSAIQERYPSGTFRLANWALGEREIRKRLEEGVAPDVLIDAAAKYCEQQRAKGDSIGTSFILSPERFFGPEAHWRGPFPTPKAASQARSDSVRDEFLRRTSKTGTSP